MYIVPTVKSPLINYDWSVFRAREGPVVSRSLSLLIILPLVNADKRDEERIWTRRDASELSE
jgi:hypothetical protein